MSRWPPDARARLRQASLELYREQGFDQTTAAEIAERAGLTKRTFFRHFADKREVLFSGEVDDLLVKALVDAPPDAAPLRAVIAALNGPSDLLDARRDSVRERRDVIAANPSLQERESIKLERLAADMASALSRRGAGADSAIMIARIGAALFKSAFDLWVDDAGDYRSYRDAVQVTVDGLRTAALDALNTAR